MMYIWCLCRAMMTIFFTLSFKKYLLLFLKIIKTYIFRQGFPSKSFSRVAIFSMWNSEERCRNGEVELVDSGPGTEVTGFGGEGTGLKCMRDLDWQLGQDVTFLVTGQRQHNQGE